MFIIVWKYSVPARTLPAFVEEYGANGPWCRFFRESDAYIASTLYRGGEGEFLLIDEWRDEQSYRDFLRIHHDRYGQMSAAGKELYKEEVKIGEYSAERPPS